MKLLSYNIRKAVGLDWRRDPARILKVIESAQADVVVLQEADKRLKPRPSVLDRGVLRDMGYQVAPVATTPVSLGWHGNAVLVRRPLTIDRVERIDLPGIEPRGAVAVTVETPDAGQLVVVGVHLGLRRRCRVSQLLAIRRALGSDRLPHTLISGDFNEWQDGSGLDPLREGFEILNPGRSFHASLPMASLDRIAHGRGIDLPRCGVLETPLARRASDHLPIWAEIARVA
ncbi:metal-dependent hydrolase [Mesobaculum littorinae]|uniref:Metal-dependent hydrolase n=1 Tax=Mesobaculum littorinae TaxID=2486419 RepID=A0A438AHX3_9RHOB|nr:metal-dependent hydrolase [Mesobaculum littorinae]